MKTLEECLKELHPNMTLYKLWILMGKSVSQSQLYSINRDPEKDIKMSTASLIFDVTRNKLGRGLAPWDYLLNVQDFSKQKKTFSN